MSANEVLVEVKDLEKHFKLGKKSILRAVDGISFSIHKGETLGLVGESGCGKSTVGRTITQLYTPTGGEVLFNQEKLHAARSKEEQKKFKRSMQMIFQDPYSSLNPRMTVQEIIGEGLLIHRPNMSKKERDYRVVELLEMVGLNQKHAYRYPHEFSGGQRQRVGIARALAVEPQFIVADEPIAALDVSIQAQIVNLLKNLQEEKGLTYLFIAHDLSMVKHISDRIAVMYLGKIVEMGESEELYEKPLHPYTEALLSAIPLPDPKLERTRERIILKGDVPSPTDLPSGCRFRTRCPKAMDICSQAEPAFREAEPGRFVACHLYE
ncbi:MAG TPA: oligopeptide/dipeptide ABC transporter ATP-binding protein [Bacillus sp. (in: firmicutes)]|uniref:ABC transporter ATP-binding protein n=1 Tax=Bacillus litorisediminis TaxID=2922713 RepID=UPI001FAD8191|nr:oligopeptide/dipeptide ABC transporter ATP-binding protein [Bacillus litorisediminis]HWO75941.1 oligopeptide/dipeptide ABC transporter ATP-binding protein [Bacillus sp. (in: firmicutes)]